MKTLSKIVLALSFLTAGSLAHAEVRQVNIKIKDHKFTPSEVSVTADEEFKLIIENLDATAEEFESHDLKKEKMIMPGKKITISFSDGLKAGEYKFFGDFHQKTAQGRILAK